MALPIARVIEINDRSIKILEEYKKEMALALRQGDLAKIGEIHVATDCIIKILGLVNQPYLEQFRSMLPDDVLRTFGLLNDDSTDEDS